MTKGLTLKNIHGLDVLKFKNIKLMYDDDFKRIVFQLSIDFEFFKACTTLDAEEFDFINMKDCLKKIYDKEWKSFTYNPIGEQFIMQFDSLENDQIKVRVKLCNPMFTGKFEFEFNTNPAFIPDLIKEIEIAINS